MGESGRGLRREWKPRLDAGSTEWRGGDAAALEVRAREIAAETGLSSVTARVCLLRGLDAAAPIREFLNPALDRLTQPLKIRDMEAAVARLAQARAEGARVRVFGDYDVDGTTGAALLTWIFREMGFQADATQPDRFKDGYGLNVGAVEQAVADGVSVLVTVDCGITSFDAAERARALRLDLIVVDHHQIDPKRGLPPALAVVNPQRADCESGLRQLCGCGLAFYLAMALRAHGRANGWFGEGTGPNLRDHLDLVVIATAADMVPLTGDNRILVRHGLEVLKASKKPGVRALIDSSGLGARAITPGSLGFVLGPRINASGRMQSASVAFRLLTTSDPFEAMELARELEKLNEARRATQDKIWDQIRVDVERGIGEGRFRHGVVVASPEWHEGVVGIVASRVTETFHRPAAVIAIREDGIGKGSVRSFAGKDVLEALRASAPALLGFGGHRHAAGLTVDPARVAEFALAFDGALSALGEEEDLRPILIEGECGIEEFDLKTLGELELLAPFGPGNPEPVFVTRAEVRERQVLKGRHLKLKLGPVAASMSGSRARMPTIEAIWFNAADRVDADDPASFDGLWEWAAVPELNRFRGKVTPTLRIRDQRRIPDVGI